MVSLSVSASPASSTIIDSQIWQETYHQAVYGAFGLELWHHKGDEADFTIRLQAGKRITPEGDLRLTLFVDDLPLHHINFSWLRETEDTVVPFIGRSQSCSSYHPDAREIFERCFPNNSPAYFCFAAVPGMARLVGAPSLRGVRSCEQIGAELDEGVNFARAYDDFWKSLGGTEDGGFGVHIPLPDHNKPLTQSSNSHRKRAKKRRRHWAAIEESTMLALAPLLSPNSHAVVRLVRGIPTASIAD